MPNTNLCQRRAATESSWLLLIEKLNREDGIFFILGVVFEDLIVIEGKMDLIDIGEFNDF